MKKYKCEVCGYIYDPQLGDPDNGIEPGTAFEDLPEDWVLPAVSGGQGSVRADRLKTGLKSVTKGMVQKRHALFALSFAFYSMCP